MYCAFTEGHLKRLGRDHHRGPLFHPASDIYFRLTAPVDQSAKAIRAG
jgi:hypothetical protein